MTRHARLLAPLFAHGGHTEREIMPAISIEQLNENCDLIECYIKAHPRCTCKAISIALNMPLMTCRDYLGKLQGDGIISPIKQERHTLPWLWELGTAPPKATKQTVEKQSKRTVQAWPPLNIAPQTWFSGLCHA